MARREGARIELLMIVTSAENMNHIDRKKPYRQRSCHLGRQEHPHSDIISTAHRGSGSGSGSHSGSHSNPDSGNSSTSDCKNTLSFSMKNLN